MPRALAHGRHADPPRPPAPAGRRGDPDADTRDTLRRARLKYADPDAPGIGRRKRGSAYAFVRATGAAVRDDPTLARIRALAIPPAWERVWISPDPRGHIQAVGRDARGRKQYRYHPDWRKVRDEGKYGHVIEFAKALPAIRRTARRHLKLPGLPKQKVLAAVVLVMEKTLIRVGNDEYAKQNGSYGLTTLQDRHATVAGGKVRFSFRGKSGVEHDIDLADAALADIVRQCRELPGQELFQYVNDKGVVRDIGSGDVNNYLRAITGQDFTAKDYRTWAGTVLAAKALRAFEQAAAGGRAVGRVPMAGRRKAAAAVVAAPARGLKKHLVKAIETVAERLGNTRAVCRKCYIHPAVLDAYLDGSLVDRLKERAAAELKIARRHGLDEDEAAVLRMLERTL
jgi:DNA topoisomerase-1